MRSQPIMMAAEPLPVLANHSEGVNVGSAGIPIDELDAELERRLGAPHELGFVQLDKLIVFLDRGDRRFADSNRADRFAFDQLHFVEALEQLAEQRGGHPAGRAAANNEDLAHRSRD